MTNIAHQAYLRTRLAILSSQLLGKQRLTEMSRLPLDELSALTGFADVKGDHTSTRLATFERLLMQTWLDELSALLRPLGADSRVESGRRSMLDKHLAARGAGVAGRDPVRPPGQP